jgi:membrane protein implicated in regulation of membrane protease activity
VGILVGLGGNYLIKRVGYAQVSSDISMAELKGITGKVLVPFSSGERGKISLVVRGNQVRLIARALDDLSEEEFAPGEEVVVVRTENGVAEVVKPN